ncbi:hypothetical protein V8C35DRAFT_59599 [Trichoderma chlorosporum]
MPPQDIRLRLVIRRHGLPEVKLVWPCSCSEDLTIAKVLEQVNDVIPLESGEWGLEDYAVELADGKGGSFECLHFQQVGRILKDEDQVLIRSLLTGDLKRRRLSGRHQISDDGRHLVDGLPFGRSWLRTPRDRPHIELPPRKRIRVSYEAEDKDEDEEPLFLGASRASRYEIPNNARIVDLNQDHYYDDEDDLQDYEEYHDDSSSMSDASPQTRPHIEDRSEESEIDDFTDEEEDDEDLETELRLLREEAGAEFNDLQTGHATSSHSDEEDVETDEETDDEYNTIGANLNLKSAREARSPFSMGTGSSVAPVVKDHTNIPVEILMTVFQAAFPELNADIRAALTRTNKDLKKAYLSLSLLCEPLCTFDQMMDDSYFLLAPFARQKWSDSVSKQPEQAKLPPFDSLRGKVKKPLIQEVDEGEESTTNGVVISAKKSKQSWHLGRDETSDSDSDGAKVAEDEASIGEEDSQIGSESSSESDSESDSNDSSSSEEEDGRINQPETAFAHEKSSDVSSDESSNEDSDGNSRLGVDDALVEASSEASSSESSKSDSADDSDSQSDSEPDSGSESGSGSEADSAAESESESDSESEVEEISSKQPVPSALQKRDIKAANSLQVQAPDKQAVTGLTRTQKRNARRRRLKAQKELDPQQPKLVNDDGEDDMTEDILARKKALLAAILDETHEGDDAHRNMRDASFIDVAPEEESGETNADVAEIPNADETGVSVPKDEPTKRHARVDMGAGRRLVFGALGLKAPTNKADEQKIRDSLMKDIRPLVNSRVEGDNRGDDTNVQSSSHNEDEDADAWRENITYRAVECCHEDMVLSEPPFPFVQRWDPQQNYGAMKKRKRASEAYQADTSYDDSTYYYDDALEEEQYETAPRKKSKKKKGRSTSLQDRSVNEGEQDVILDYDEAPLKSSQFTDVDDLPSLPKDVKALPLVEPTSAQPGMVITWSQLVMSKATNWQPEMVPATGLIVPGGEDGAVHVILARRDREDNEKIYDEVTGERVYGKFEVPDLDEEGDEEDTGFRSLQWAEMIEPRILQQAPADEVAQTSTDAIAAAVEDGVPPGQDKVSEFQPVQDSFESGFGTGEVRAAIEDDLMHDSLGTQAHLETVSIQSGQRLPRLDLSMSEVQISTASNSFEHIGHNHPKTIDAQSERVLTVTANPQNAHSPKLTRWMERGDEAATDQEAELGPSLADAVAEDVSNSDTLASKRAESSEDNGRGEEKREEEGQDSTRDGNDASTANHANTVIASSQFSIPSGRQPRTSYSIAEGIHDTVIPETLPQLRETTPIENHSRSQSTPSTPASSSPFPSLEEIFLSAQPTQSSGRRRETPSLAASGSVPASAPVGDSEYEEAMRKLDEGHESDLLPEKKHLKEEEVVDRKLFPNATQPSLPAQPLDQSLPAPQISPSQSQENDDGKLPYVVPAGSQIIVLSSSPVSDRGVADEDNGSEVERSKPVRKRGSLPTGPGWVRKGPRQERDASGSTKTRAATASTRASRRRRSDNEALAVAPLVSPVSKHKERRSR